MYAGGWVTGSPLLTEKPEFFFVQFKSRSIQWLEDFYRERGVSLRVEKVDTIVVDGEELFEVFHVY